MATAGDRGERPFLIPDDQIAAPVERLDVARLGEALPRALPPLHIPSSGPAVSIRGRRPKILPTPTPFPETRPNTIEGWIVRDVVGQTATLEGPGGTWSVMSGDTVPGVGKVESIVRWGSRWIVATSRGLISTQ